MAGWRLAEVCKDVKMHRCDVADRDVVRQLLEAVRPSWIFHLAAYGAYESQGDVHRIFETNVMGTMNVALAAADTGCDAFINAGSSSEYGFKDHAPPESECLEPASFYGASKGGATLFCRALARRRNLPLATLRLYSVYGPFEEPSRLIPSVICRGLQGEYPPLADPETSRDFIHVDDVMSAFEAAAGLSRLEGQVYNVGTAVGTRLRDVAALSRTVFGIDAEPHWGAFPSRHWDTNVWIADPSAMEKTGWKASTAFDVGFRSTADWIESDPQRRAWYAERSAPRSAHESATEES